LNIPLTNTLEHVSYVGYEKLSAIHCVWFSESTS